MRVRLAKTAGFCMGVRRAMELALSEANRGDGPLYTFGPLIHNNQVLDLLKSKGVVVVDDIGGLSEGRIIIRAHGIPPEKRKVLRKSSLKVIDGTCPKVAKVQAIIQYNTKKGKTAVIIGDEDHPEVIGLKGYAKTPAHVINSVEEISSLPNSAQIFVVAQTTQDQKNYHEITSHIKKRFAEAEIFETICDATQLRQDEIRSLADSVDAMVVVGGFNSGNTRRLVQVSEGSNLLTQQVETEKDLDKKKINGMELIGVTAGASTPNWMIKNVAKEIEGIEGRNETRVDRWLKRVSKFSILSNFFVAASAFSFSYAISILSERDTGLTYPFLTFCYIYAMYVLNRFLDKGASVYNDPERALFYRNRGKMLILMALASITTALIVSYFIGKITFLALAVLSLLGLLYSLPLIPHRFRYLYKYSKIKDIPGSKPLSEALAWVALICVLPILEGNSVAWGATACSMLVVFSMSYARSILFDIFQFQGDLIVGSETLPIIFGLRKTVRLLRVVLISVAIILVWGPFFGLCGPFSYVFLIPLALFSICVIAYEKNWINPGLGLEALVECNFLLAGLLGLLWQAFYLKP